MADDDVTADRPKIIVAPLAYLVSVTTLGTLPSVDVLEAKILLSAARMAALSVVATDVMAAADPFAVSASAADLCACKTHRCSGA